MRDGDDIRVELPVSISEAVLGGKVRVPTPSGAVDMTLKPHSSSGMTLRLKGKGVAKRNGEKGDLYVTLKIVLPDKPDPRLTELIGTWAQSQAHNPREQMGV